jgi:uncharacterized protein (TIGR02246 family)
MRTSAKTERPTIEVVNRGDATGLVGEIEAAWNGHDMSRFAACFATDADFVNVAGAWWRGREEIEERHAAMHAGMFKDSTMQLRLASFREIGPGIVVMHVTWRLEGHGESGPRRTNTGTPDSSSARFCLFCARNPLRRACVFPPLQHSGVCVDCA